MIQEVNIQQVVSFQVFVRDNKPKMNVYYPFLSQEQILSKLRQQWKKLDSSKRQPYTKLVLTKKKAIKTRKVKVVTIAGCRLPKGKQIGTSKNADIVRNNDDDDDDFGFNNLSDDSYIHDDYELDSMSENSPFMHNKFAIDSLNSGFCPDTKKPKKNVKKGGVGKTFAGCDLRVMSETVHNSKTGILQTLCKNRRKSQGHVSISAGKATGNDDNGYEFYDEDIDDEVLYVESSTRSKIYESTCRNKAVDMMMLPRRINLEEVEDHSLMLGCQDNPALKYSLTGGELRMPQSKNSLTGGELRMPQSKNSLTGGELRMAQSKNSLTGGELRMPQSKNSLTGGELRMPQSKNSLTGGELRMPQSKNSLTGGELRMPQSKNSLTGGELRMPQSKNSLTGGELRMPQSKNSLSGGELRMPQSKNSLTGGELKMPQSKNSLTGGELRMPQSKNSLTGGELRMPQSKYSLTSGELRMPQSKKQKLNLKTPDKTTTVKPSDNTPSRFSRRLRNLSPNDVDATLCGRSLHGSSALHFSEKPKRTSAFVKKATNSVKNNITSVERKGQSFCVASQNMAAEVKVQSCRQDNGNELIDDQDELQIVSGGGHGDCQSEQKLAKKLQNKTTVNRNSVSTKSSSHVLDCGVSESVTRFSNRPITPGCQTPVFDFPQSSKRCVRSAGHKSDSSDEAWTKTSSVKISQSGDFSEEDTDGKDDDRCRLSEEESDSDIGDTVRKAVCQTGKRNVSVYELNLKSRIKRTSENMKTDFFGRESNIRKTKVDNSDKENDRKCYDQDGCHKEDNVHVELHQTRKQTDSVVETYLKKITVKKCGNIPFDFCGQESNIHRKYIASSDEENNGEVNDKDSFLRNDVDNKALYYRNQQNTTEACSKRHTFKETERTISDLSGKGNYKHMKDADRYKECEERNKECDGIISYYTSDVVKGSYKHREYADRYKECEERNKECDDVISYYISDVVKESYKHKKDVDRYKECEDRNKEFYDVKNAPCTKVSDTPRRQDDLQQHNENGCYQTNRVADPLAVYTNKTTERTNEISKGKKPDECEKLKHVMVTKKEIKQVGDKTVVKQCSDKGIVEVAEHKHCKSESAFQKKNSYSVQKQKNKSKMRKKSAVTRKHTAVNHVPRGNNNVKRAAAVTIDNYSMNESWTSPAALEYDIIQQSHLDNSSTNEEIQHESHLDNLSRNKIIHLSSHTNNSNIKHTQEIGGQHFPSRKETPNLDVEKFKFPTDFSKGSTTRLQSGLLEEDCSYSSNIDCRKNCQMDCRNMSIMDCRNNPKISWKAEDGFSSNQESGTSDDSLESDAGEDDETNQDDFLVNMTNQTTSALLQAIDRLKSLTSPQVNLIEEWAPDGGPQDLPENNGVASVSTEQQLLNSMFQDVPQNVNRAYVTPAKKRLLASSATETPSNFMAMFDDSEIFL